MGLSLEELFFAGILFLLIVDPPKAIMYLLSNRVLVWVGKLSYSLYLWHLYANFATERSGLDRKFWIISSLVLAFAFLRLLPTI